MSDEVNATGGGEANTYAEYTTEELLEQAASNAQAMTMATALFLHQKRIPLEEWAEALGKVFALGWNDSEPWEAGEFLDAMLTNVRALGGKVVSSQLDADHAEATTTGFPSTDMSEFFSIDPALSARFLDCGKVLAGRLGLTWEWKRTGERVRFTVERAVTASE